MLSAEEDASEGSANNGSNDIDSKRYIDELDNSSSKKAKKIKLEADDESNISDLVIDEKNSYLEENPEENHSAENASHVLDNLMENKKESNNKVINNVGLNKNEEITKNGLNLTKSPETNSTKKGLNSEKVEKKTNLEKEIAHLGNLLKLKEEEWNVILRLKKMKEILLEHLRREFEISEVLQTSSSVGAVNSNCDFSDLPTSTTTTTQNQNDKNENSRIPGEGEIIRLNIEQTEREISELECQLKQHHFQKDSLLKNSPGSELAKLGEFKASLALQQLSERNRTSLTQANLPLNISSSPNSNKVIGEGRQGTIVEVRSIIAEHRSKNNDESHNGGKKVVKKSIQPQSQPNPHLNQPPNISFKDVLLSLAQMSKRENSGRNSPVVTGSTKRNQSTSNHLTLLPTVNPTRGPIGTTLAKLLSSPNPPSKLDDTIASTQINKMTTNNNVKPESSISLANLLASAKSHDRDIASKNEEVEDDESVPLCQGCNNNRAQFVCAGCSCQWYCSRECQVAAWDEHSEVCTG